MSRWPEDKSSVSVLAVGFQLAYFLAALCCATMMIGLTLEPYEKRQDFARPRLLS